MTCNFSNPPPQELRTKGVGFDTIFTNCNYCVIIEIKNVASLFFIVRSSTRQDNYMAAPWFLQQRANFSAGSVTAMETFISRKTFWVPPMLVTGTVGA